MDKVKEAFEEWLNTKAKEEPEMDFVDILHEKKVIKHHTDQQYQADWAYGFYAGYQAANLLPIEKDCPECGGRGQLSNFNKGEPMEVLPYIACPNCTDGKIQIYQRNNRGVG